MYMNLCMYARCMYVQLNVFIHVYVCAREVMFIHLCVCVFVCVCVWLCVCVYMCMCVCVCMCVCYGTYVHLLFYLSNRQTSRQIVRQTDRQTDRISKVQWHHSIFAFWYIQAIFPNAIFLKRSYEYMCVYVCVCFIWCVYVCLACYFSETLGTYKTHIYESYEYMCMCVCVCVCVCHI
jgi:hypothetical protein